MANGRLLASSLSDPHTHLQLPISSTTTKPPPVSVIVSLSESNNSEACVRLSTNKQELAHKVQERYNLKNAEVRFYLEQENVQGASTGPKTSVRNLGKSDCT